MSVVVVGSVNRDVVARVPRIPGPGETLLATGLSRGGGGKGGNQAVAAARAGGADCAFVGAVGDDPDGVVLRDGLAADGVDVSGVAVSELPSGTALISVADDGENAIVVAAGANAALTELDRTQQAIVAGAGVVACQLEIPVPLLLDAARARSQGAPLVLNAAPSGALMDPVVAADVLPETDVLIVNEHELRDIAGLEDRDAAVAALAERVPALVVTLGADGCVVAAGDDRREVSAFPARAVDTTGAGDTFCGVFAARLDGAGRGAGIDVLAEAARAGAAAAALAVGRTGAQDSVPAAAEVDELLAGSA